MSQNIRIGVIHRSQLFRECLAMAFADRHPRGVEFVTLNHGEASDAELLEQRLDVVLLDLNLPQRRALQLARHAAEHVRELRIVALVSATNHDQLPELAVAGCRAWVHEESPIEELLTAINDVLSGRFFYSPALIDAAFAHFRRIAQDVRGQREVAPPPLTARELEILGLVSKHLSNKQIAEHLSISLYTVKNHVHSILEKLSVENRHRAVDQARWNRWLR